MKNLLYALVVCLAIFSCSKTDIQSEPDNETYTPCGSGASGQKLYKGSKGGCFYYNNNGNKTYVDRGECKC